jgi:hypothetical protein
VQSDAQRVASITKHLAKSAWHDGCSRRGTRKLSATSNKKETSMSPVVEFVPSDRPSARRLSAAVVVAASLALAGCGGSIGGGGGGGGGPASLTGSVDSTTFSVGSAVAWSAPGTKCSTSEDCTPSGQTIVLDLTNRPGVTCGEAAAADGLENLSYANLAFLQIAVANPRENVAAGTYDLELAVGNATTSFGASFGTSTSTCAPGGQGFLQEASGGTVTFTQLSATQVTGVYDITFGPIGNPSGSFSGSFDIPICDPSGAGSGPPYAAGPSTCTQ